MTRPGWRSWQLWVVTALGVYTACTSSRGAEPSSSPPVSRAQEFLSGTCPVTSPVPPDQVPETVVSTIGAGYEGPAGGLTFNYWYGNDALWVELAYAGHIVKPPGEELSEKFPWVRLARGDLTIEGRRLDGPAPPARASVPSGYGPSGFQASGIGFPAEGCWEITGKIAHQKLTFVVEVRRASG